MGSRKVSKYPANPPPKSEKIRIEIKILLSPRLSEGLTPSKVSLFGGEIATLSEAVAGSQTKGRKRKKIYFFTVSPICSNKNKLVSIVLCCLVALWCCYVVG